MFCIIVLHLAFDTVTPTVIHSQRGPVFRDPSAQTTDGDFGVLDQFSIKRYSPYSGCDREGSPAVPQSA